MLRITPVIAALTWRATCVFLLIGSQSPALAIDGQASSEIAVTLQPLRNVGVAFGWLPRATTTVTVTLNAPSQPEAMTIVDKKDKSTIPLDFGGKTIWRRTETTETKHVWKGYGFSADFPERVINTGTYVRFEGLLAKPGPLGVSPTPFKASVAAIDIDVDSTDKHSDGPTGNWPPISDTTPRGEIEDFDEDTPLGGLYLPVLSNQPLPDTINITAAPYKFYKTLNLKLSTSWGGHPQGDPPSWAGELKFAFGGKGFALYEIVEGSDQAQQIYDQNDPDPNHRKKLTFRWLVFPTRSLLSLRTTSS